MSWLKQKTKERARTRVEKRVDSLPTDELLSWTEQALYGIGRNLSSWQRTRDAATLEEARMGAEVLYTILQTINQRVRP